MTRCAKLVWLGVSFYLAFSSGILHADPIDFGITNDSNAPKLIGSIDDQSLFIDQDQQQSLGPIDAQQLYVRDLTLTFTSGSETSFSAYVYNEEVVDAFVLDDQLVVIAKEPGDSQIAITARNKHGSMIDWFEVTVKRNKQATDNASSTQPTAFSSALQLVSVNGFSDSNIQLPTIPGDSTTYMIFPSLPAGLRFDTANAVLSGRLQSHIEDQRFFLAGVSGEREISIQRFTLYEELGSNRAVLYATKPSQVNNAYLNSLVTFSSRRPYPLSRYATSEPVTVTTSGRARLASRAPQNPNMAMTMRLSVRQQFLSGLQNAMHSRFRNSSFDDSLDEQDSVTFWQYANTRGLGNSSTSPNSALKRTGIYIGFDTEIEENWTTGLTIGIDRGRSQSGNPNLAHDTSANPSALTAFSPYARWQDEDGSEVWGMVGFGRDNTVQTNYGRARSTNVIDNELVIGAVGWRQLLGSIDNMRLATVGDAGFVIPLDSNTAAIRPNSLQEAMTQSIRAGIEMSYAGERMQPYFGISGFLGGSSIETDSSLEAMGGVRYTSLHGFTVEAEGRTLATQNFSRDRAWVFSVAARLDPGQRGQGLSLSIAPTYGMNTRAIGSYGTVSNPYYSQHNRLLSYDNIWTMSGTLSYGVPVRGAGVITPFGELAISTLNETRMGVRFELNSKIDKLLDFEIAGVQSRTYRNSLDKGIDVQLRLVF